MRQTSRAFAVLAALGTWATIADAQDFRPIRRQPPLADLGTCRTAGTLESGSSRDVVVSFEVDETGRVGAIELPAESPDWLKSLADCVIGPIAFEPEVRGGKLTRTRAQLRLTVVAEPEGARNEITVTRVADLITAPHFRDKSSRVIENCLSLSTPTEQVWQFVINVTVAPDGSVAAVEIPPGAPAWIEQTGSCFKGRLTFYPGTHDGIAVAAVAAVPINLNNSSRATIQPAQPATSGEELEAAYRACYPPDQAAMGSVLFTFDVTIDGVANNARIVRGSGDPILDKTAACVLPQLRFEPTKRGKRPIKSSITWELPVRPPR